MLCMCTSKCRCAWFVAAGDRLLKRTAFGDFGGVADSWRTLRLTGGGRAVDIWSDYTGATLRSSMINSIFQHIYISILLTIRREKVIVSSEVTWHLCVPLRMLHKVYQWCLVWYSHHIIRSCYVRIRTYVNFSCLWYLFFGHGYDGFFFFNLQGHVCTLCCTCTLVACCTYLTAWRYVLVLI